MSRSNVDAKFREKLEPQTLTIVHKEPEIRITKAYEHNGRQLTTESIYYTDGRAEFHSESGYTSEPETRWRGSKLRRKVVTKPYGNSSGIFQNLDAVMIEEWELSADGKTLTRTVTNSGAFAGKLRYVFTRVS